MRVVKIDGVGGPEVLKLDSAPTPEPQGDQIRVRVHACGLNRADLLQCQGVYPAPAGVPADIPGLEYAGVIDALGPDVTGALKYGDRVFGLVGGGALAEYVLTREPLVAAMPRQLDFDKAAAVPEAFITAHDALLLRGRLAPGESVLIHAVGSGVGTAAIQLARAMGCTVVGTSRTAAKLQQAYQLGLAHGIDTSSVDFASAARASTAGRGVDVVIDLIGGPAFAGNLAALAPLGRLVLVGMLGGASTSVDLSVILRKRLTIVGTTLRARPLEEKIAVTRRFAGQVVPWLERGLVSSVVDSVFPLEQFREAFLRLESNRVFGKVILRL
jgi:putative PIG3 family NAD(P)H quinone oxidoreductase